MQARRRQAWLLVRNESVRGDRLRTSTCGAHTKELPACDHGRGKRGLQRERVRKGEASDQAGSFAWSGRARACALRGRSVSVSFRFSRSVVDKKGFRKKE